MEEGSFIDDDGLGGLKVPSSRSGGIGSGASVVLYHSEELSAYKRAFSLVPGGGLRPNAQWAWAYARAIIALHGSVLMWVGAWNILSLESRYELNTNNVTCPSCTVSGQVPFSESYAMWLYAWFGLLICVTVDTLYSNAGMDTPLNPRDGLWPPQWRWWNTKWRNPWQRRIRYSMRTIIAWLGMLLMWIGFYNVLEYQVCISRGLSVFPPLFFFFPFFFFLSCLFFSLLIHFFSITRQPLRLSVCPPPKRSLPEPWFQDPKLNKFLSSKCRVRLWLLLFIDIFFIFEAHIIFFGDCLA